MLKKTLVAVAFLGLSSSALALDVGVGLNHSFSEDRNAFSLNAGQKFGSFGVQAGFERFTKNANDQDRYSLTASYDVTKLGSSVVYVKGGAAYLNNQVGADGFAWLAGAGVNIPVTKNISGVVDFTHQFGQNRVNSFNGNTLGLGIKYSF